MKLSYILVTKKSMKYKYAKGEVGRKEVVQSLEGWLAYAGFADTYNLRRKVVARFNELFGSHK